MDLVPPYIEVDQLVVPLRVEPREGDWPARALPRSGEVAPLLDGLKYALGTLTSMPAQEVLALLHARKEVLSTQSLEVSPVRPEDGNDFDRAAKNWERLTGTPLDMSDVYFASASFVREDVLLPTNTFIKLMTRLYEINDALREGRMEPRIDDSIPLPPPRPPPPPPKWTDEELRDLEDRAAQLDELDPLTEDLSDSRIAKKAEWHRSYLLEMLNFAYKRERDGVDDAISRIPSLGLTELLRYQEAFEALSAYLQAPERLSMVEPVVEAAKREAKVTEPATCAERAAAEGFEVTPFCADVSIDLFRLPEAARPDGVSKIEWMARCEAVFLYDRIRGMVAQGANAGDVFTRILGHRVRMRYRPEMTPTLRLWRVELI